MPTRGDWAGEWLFTSGELAGLEGVYGDRALYFAFSSERKARKLLDLFSGEMRSPPFLGAMLPAGNSLPGPWSLWLLPTACPLVSISMTGRLPASCHDLLCCKETTPRAYVCLHLPSQEHSIERRKATSFILTSLRSAVLYTCSAGHHLQGEERRERMKMEHDSPSPLPSSSFLH